jgi:F0F1-type ATP synthase membrane subunit c/vacuolar-type H+-ATPase subunit K
LYQQNETTINPHTQGAKANRCTKIMKVTAQQPAQQQPAFDKSFIAPIALVSTIFIIGAYFLIQVISNPSLLQ